MELAIEFSDFVGIRKRTYQGSEFVGRVKQGNPRNCIDRHPLVDALVRCVLWWSGSIERKKTLVVDDRCVAAGETVIFGRSLGIEPRCRVLSIWILHTGQFSEARSVQHKSWLNLFGVEDGALGSAASCLLRSGRETERLHVRPLVEVACLRSLSSTRGVTPDSFLEQSPSIGSGIPLRHAWVLGASVEAT